MDITIKPLPENALASVLRNAEANIVDGADPKAVIVDALLDHIAGELAFDVVGAIKPAVDMQIMLFGNDHAQIVNAMCDAQPEFAKIDAAARLAALAWNGDDLDTDTTVRNYIKALIPAPLPMNRGKWLAKAGIVKAHIDSIVPATTRTAPEAPEAPPAPPAPPAADLDLAAMLGLDAPAPLAPAPSAVGAAAAPPSPSAAAAPAAPAGKPYGGVASQVATTEPTQEEVRNAVVLISEAVERNDALLAERLGISRSTFYNMANGKATRTKITGEQARVLIADIDVRVGKLMAAADILRRVR